MRLSLCGTSPESAHKNQDGKRNGGAGGDNPSGVGGNGGDGGDGGSAGGEKGDDSGNSVEILTGMIKRKVRQRLEKRPEKTFLKTIPLIRNGKLVGNGIAVEAPKGYRSRGRYPASLNEQNCLNFPFCRWVL